MTVVGYRRYDFTNEHGHYSGYKIYVTIDDWSSVTGVATDSFSISDRVCESSSYIPEVGQEIDVSYRKESRSPARVYVL